MTQNFMNETTIEDAAYFYAHGFDIKSMCLSENGKTQYSLFLSDPSKFKTFRFLQHRTDIGALTFCSMPQSLNQEFANLSLFASIHELSFWDCQDLVDTTLSYVLKNQRLHILNIGNCPKITHKSFEGLSCSHQLKSLSIIDCKKINDETLTSVKRLQKLSKLNLTFCSISDLGVFFLKDMHSLETISLNHCINLSNVGLKVLSNLPKIQSMSLNKCQNMDLDSLYILQSMNRLQQLQIGGTYLSDHDLMALPVQLRSLGLGWMENLTDLGIRYLLNLTELETLVLNRCVHLTDQGVCLLSKLKKLKKLDLRNCPMVKTNPIHTPC